MKMRLRTLGQRLGVSGDEKLAPDPGAQVAVNADEHVPPRGGIDRSVMLAWPT